MADYTLTHADALADITEAGATVTFTKTSPGTYSESTDTWSTPTSDTVEGSALGLEDDLKAYRELGLTESQAATLMFAPSTYGELPELDAQVSWGGDTYSVKRVKPFRPSGSAIFAYVVISR